MVQFQVNCGRRKEAMARRHRFRYARNADDDGNTLGDEIHGVVVNKEAGAFTPPLHIDEDEEERMAQQEMDNWRYQGWFAVCIIETPEPEVVVPKKRSKISYFSCLS